LRAKNKSPACAARESVPTRLAIVSGEPASSFPPQAAVTNFKERASTKSLLQPPARDEPVAQHPQKPGGEHGAVQYLDHRVWS
jgi:hypothetical protein